MRQFFNKSFKLIKKKESAFAKNESGQVLFLFAVAALVLVIFIGTITDYGMTVSKAIKTQTAADSAAMAAGAWVARGGNVQAMINGIHWDMNHTLAQIITISADIAMVICIVCLALSWIPFGVGAAFMTVYRITKQVEDAIITACTKVHDVLKAVIEPVQQILVKITPIIAMMHANFSAKNNGASSLPELLADSIPFPADVKNSVNDIVGKITSYLPPQYNIYTWTLSPNLKIWENLEVTEVMKLEDGPKAIVKNALNPDFAHPYRIGTLMPFTAALSFWATKKSSLEWNDKYIVQKNKKAKMFGDITDWNFDFSIIMPGWFDSLIAAIEGFFDDLFDGIKNWLNNTFAFLWNWIPDIPCFGENEHGETVENQEEDESFENQVEDIAHWTFIVGMKSKLGVFLKLFGGTIGEDPDSSNVPMTFAFATVKVRGHPLHPGGLYKGSNGYEKIRLHVVPFWISSEPFFTQDRFVRGYEGDWEARLAPVQFQYKAAPKNLTLAQKLRGKKKKPKIIQGNLLGINH